MSNTITTNATIVAAETLKSLAINFPIITRIAHRFSEVYRFNQTVAVPLITSTTAAAVSYPTGYAATARSVTPRSVLIDTHVAHTFTLNPQELGSTNPAIIAELGKTGGHSLGKYIMDDLVSMITVANYANETIASSLDFNTFAGIDKALALRGVPEMDKFTVVDATGFLDLLQDTTIHSGLVNTGSRVISTGQLGDVMGQPVFRYAGLTTPSGEKLKGFMAVPDSIAIACGIPEEPANGNPASIIVSTDAESGLSVMTREVVDTNGVFQRSVTLIYGKLVGQTSMLQRIISASRT